MKPRSGLTGGRVEVLCSNDSSLGGTTKLYKRISGRSRGANGKGDNDMDG